MTLTHQIENVNKRAHILKKNNDMHIVDLRSPINLSCLKEISMKFMI